MLEKIKNQDSKVNPWNIQLWKKYDKGRLIIPQMQEIDEHGTYPE